MKSVKRVNGALLSLAKCAAIIGTVIVSIHPQQLAAGLASCGWKASSVTRSMKPSCATGSYDDCWIMYAYSNPERTIPVTIFSVLSNPLDWVDSIKDDNKDRYTKVRGYTCDWGIFYNTCNWNSPDPTGAHDGIEPSRARLVTLGNCQNNVTK